MKNALYRGMPKGIFWTAAKFNGQLDIVEFMHLCLSGGISQ